MESKICFNKLLFNDLIFWVVQLLNTVGVATTSKLISRKNSKHLARHFGAEVEDDVRF